jgi:broad specificity phosphatase PhoE
MNRFLLIRHAATESAGKKIAGRAEGTPLVELGYTQAARLAQRLSGENIIAVYSSPQERARETARALADAVGQDVQVAAELEEIDYGDWTGRSIAELQTIPQWQAFNSIRSCTRIPHGELIVEVQARVVRFIEQLRRQDTNQSVALVTHADVIRAALSYYVGSPLDLMLRLEIDPASVTILDIDNGGPIIRCVNNTEFVYP